MVEVCRARDPRFDRDVAVKILPGEVAFHPERMGRFEREARVVAALKHPTIAAIHGLEESGPRRALATAPVEGPTLSDPHPREPRRHQGQRGDPSALQLDRGAQAAMRTAIRSSSPSGISNVNALD